MNSEGMMTVKEYASAHGKSVQSVYKQMRGKETAKVLEGHIYFQRIGNKDVRVLDAEGIRILESASMQSPQVILQTKDKELIDQLRAEREQLLIKIAAQADKISELVTWKADNALLIAGAEHTRLALEAAQAEHQQQAEEYALGLAKAAQEAAEATRKAAEALEEAKAEKAAREAAEAARAVAEEELAAYRARPWWQRIFR